MKRWISYLLIFTICMTIFPISVFAKETEVVYTVEQMERIVSKYEYHEEMLDAIFCDDTAVKYWEMINNIKQNKPLSWALDKSSQIIKEYPDKKKYAEILATLITMQSGTLAEQIESQSRFDDLKNIGDYTCDIIDIATSFIGGSELFKTVAPIIDAATGGVEVIISTVEQAKYYELTIQDYAQNNAFLTAVSTYAENEELKAVANSLIGANETLFQKRLEYLADGFAEMAKYEAKFFGENLSFDLLKNMDLYNSDESVKFFVDGSSKLHDVIAKTNGLGKFTFKMMMLAGDLGLGTSDVYNRYQEMKVLADVAGALVKANKSTTVPNKTNEVKLEIIQEKCNYYKGLLATHARGEYLLYQLLMNDAGLLSDIRWITEYFKNPEDTTHAWYEKQMKYLTEYSDILDNMFVLEKTDYTEIVTSAYNNFIVQGGYNKYTQDWETTWETVPEKYGMLDINNDGILELFVNSEDMGSGWYTTLIFSYDVNASEIVFITDMYNYTGIRYSKTYNVILCTDVKPSAMCGSQEFYALKNNNLEFEFAVGHDMEEDNIYYFYYDGNNINKISESDRDKFYENLIQIEYIDLSKQEVEEDNVGENKEINLEEICRIVENYYNALYGTNIYVIFESESLKTESGYFLSLRSQGGKEANILVTGITVNINNGQVNDELNNSWNLYDYIQEKDTHIDNELDTDIVGDFETIIETIRECYYEIENQLASYTVDRVEDSYTRYIDNGIMRKITLYPNEFELRDMTEEFYYDQNGKLVFAFVHDGENEFRYYFYNGLIYRYINNNGDVSDYENGRDPYEVDGAGQIHSSGELEKHYYFGG